MDEVYETKGKIFKVIVIGDKSVGKTAIVNRYTKEEFYDNIQSTIGADYTSKIVQLDDEFVKLNIWDLSGQERYSSLFSVFFRDAKGCFIVYDISKKESFDNLNKKFNLIKNIAEFENRDIAIILVGNKKDLEEERKVTTKEGEEFANKMGCHFFETSAQNNENINEIFEKMLNEINTLVPKPQQPKANIKTIKLIEKPEEINQGSYYCY